MVDDRNPMDDDSVEEEDIAEGMIPAHASTIVATDKKLQTPMDTNGRLQTPTDPYGQLQTPTEVMAEKPQVMEPKLRTPTEVTAEKLQTPMEVTAEKLQTPMESKSRSPMEVMAQPRAVLKMEPPPLYYSSRRAKLEKWVTREIPLYYRSRSTKRLRCKIMGPFLLIHLITSRSIDSSSGHLCITVLRNLPI
jgi:hypothetical protein